jgi:hypothetical protein
MKNGAVQITLQAALPSAQACPGKACTGPMMSALTVKQFGMRSRANKHNHATRPLVIEAIHLQEITADIALSMPFPVAFERMIEPPCSGCQHATGDK